MKKGTLFYFSNAYQVLMCEFINKSIEGTYLNSFLLEAVCKLTKWLFLDPFTFRVNKIVNELKSAA